MWGASLRLHTKTVQAAAYGETMQAKAMPSIWEKKAKTPTNLVILQGGRQIYFSWRAILSTC